MTEYTGPAAGLLPLGKIDPRAEWLDYRSLGIGGEHGDELARMLLDEELFNGDTESPEFWAPVHAFRALGQLHSAEAMGALLEARRRSDERGGDWFTEEFPLVMGLLGPPALPALAVNLRDTRAGAYPRWNTAESIVQIAQKYPETRADCVTLISGELERLQETSSTEENLDTLRGGLIGCLVDLKAVEAAPLIERVFAAGTVDEFVAGDWEVVRYRLGLGPAPKRKARPAVAPPPPGPRPGSPKDRARERKKAARQAKKGRKKR